MDNETNYIEEQVLVCESVDELKEIISHLINRCGRLRLTKYLVIVDF